ncbi:hypothetical protein MPSEU_000052500 [Mayamaea pseudoterrestris]|nr:hypothetical protein MPSEU_000052500 [Mayamaea pseudoterrestris]
MPDDDDTKSSTPTSPPAAAAPRSWKLPDGIEDHLTTGLIYTTIGAAVGGLVGVVLFKSGGGMRAASMATGVGVAWGSTYERIKK